MARYQLARVFYPETPLDRGFEQIPQLGEDGNTDARHNASQRVGADRRREKRPGQRREEKPADRPRPGLAGAHLNPELRPAEATADEIGTDIGRDHDEDKPQQQEGPLGISRPQDEERAHGEPHVEKPTDQPAGIGAPNDAKKNRAGREDREANGYRRGHRGIERYRAADRSHDEGRGQLPAVPGHHAMILPEHQHIEYHDEGERPVPPRPQVEQGDEGKRHSRGCAPSKIREADRARGCHRATAPNRLSRAPKPWTSIANWSAVKSGHRVSTKENSE